MLMLRVVLRPLLALLLLLPAGCASISKGVAEAVLEQKTEDERDCVIQGEAFAGLRQSLAAQAQTGGVTKVLMVHGIGPHLPGYANRLRERLLAQLDLTITDVASKRFAIAADNSGKGQTPADSILTVTRHRNKAGDQTLLFYELTWAGITAPQKAVLAYDSENNDGLKRAGLNGSLKRFINETVPDMLIYMGSGQQQITAAVKEATCWMLGADWASLPASGRQRCAEAPQARYATLAADDGFFITHSLGSLITIDTIQSFARQMAEQAAKTEVQRIQHILRDKRFTVFMLSNQLPLLHLGRQQEGADETDFCSAQTVAGKQRVLGQLRIVAISDPNDILSYPVRDDFTRNALSSRICTRLVNVSLNVAAEKDVFGATSFADPLTAHSGYLEDDRVIRLITDGMGAEGAAHFVSPRQCRWQEVKSF